MCRLFGFRSAVPSKAHRSLVEADNSLVDQASKHPHGWGMAYFVAQDAYILKSADGAHTCDRFRLASSRLTSHTFVVHVRKATVGVVDYLNSHPFRLGRWVFAHNGTIWDFEGMRSWMLDRIAPERRPLILGNTDSEHLFHYLITALEQAGFDPHGHAPILDATAAGQVLHDALGRVYARAEQLGSDAPICNYVLTNGAVFFAVRAGRELFLATQKSTCRDFHSCVEPDKYCMLEARPPGQPVNHVLVSSERIGTEDVWEPMEHGQMAVLSADWRLTLLPPFEHFKLSRVAI